MSQTFIPVLAIYSLRTHNLKIHFVRSIWLDFFVGKVQYNAYQYTNIVLNCSTINFFFFVLSISYYHISKEVVAISNLAKIKSIYCECLRLQINQ